MEHWKWLGSQQQQALSHMNCCGQIQGKVPLHHTHENRSTLQSHYCERIGAEVKDHLLRDFRKACK